MRLLLHMCCGPCACYPVKSLREKGIEPVGWFFNPNIHPYKEWKQRLDTAQEFAAKVKLEMVADAHYQLRAFLGRALAAGDNAGRCRMCYTWRLGEAARYAAENGFSAFTSTLFYSIYQDHGLMKETAEKFAREYGVDFYYEDFRAGWQEGIDISRALELYRQPYCGCIFSEEERYNKALRKKKKQAVAESGGAILQQEIRAAGSAAL